MCVSLFLYVFSFYSLIGGITMASHSESAAEKGGLRWAVSPTEDMVQALLETLVDHLLPLRVSSVPPSEDVQITVAKQVTVNLPLLTLCMRLCR